MNVLEAIRERRSIRCYQDEPVKKEDIETIAEAAIWAPNAMNAQVWHFSVVTDRALIADMTAATKAGMANGPIPFMRERAKDPAYDPLFRAPLVIVISRADGKFGAFDCGCAAENICLAAKELGYDTCITAGTEFMFAGDPGLREKLQMPEGYTFVCAITVGVKKDAPDSHVRDRKEDVVSYIE